MLTTPDNLLFLHLLDDDLQNELLHHFSWDGGKADWPVVPWVRETTNTPENNKGTEKKCIAFNYPKVLDMQKYCKKHAHRLKPGISSW